MNESPCIAAPKHPGPSCWRPLPDGPLPIPIEDNGHVLVRYEGSGYIESKHFSTIACWNGPGDGRLKITHWMPLPKLNSTFGVDPFMHERVKQERDEMQKARDTFRGMEADAYRQREAMRAEKDSAFQQLAERKAQIENLKQELAKTKARDHVGHALVLERQLDEAKQQREAHYARAIAAEKASTQEQILRNDAEERASAAERNYSHARAQVVRLQFDLVDAKAGPHWASYLSMQANVRGRDEENASLTAQRDAARAALAESEQLRRNQADTIAHYQGMRIRFDATITAQLADQKTIASLRQELVSNRSSSELAKSQEVVKALQAHVKSLDEQLQPLQKQLCEFSYYSAWLARGKLIDDLDLRHDALKKNYACVRKVADEQQTALANLKSAHDFMEAQLAAARRSSHYSRLRA